MIESGRIILRDHVMHFNVDLTGKMKYLITNISFKTLIIMFYHCLVNEPLNVYH